MSLLDNNVETETTQIENAENVENTEITTETTQEQQDWLNDFKTGLGEEWNDKYENLIKKFSKDNKLDTVELLKAHRNLEKSFSEKRQAPEKYEITYEEGLEDFKIGEDDGLYQNFISKSKELNLTNDQANGLINMISSYLKDTSIEMSELEKVNAEETAKRDAEIIKSIPNYAERKNEINNFLQSKLSPEEVEGLKGVVKTPAALNAIEKLMKLNRDPVIPVSPSKSGFGGDDFDAKITELRKSRDSAHPMDQSKIDKMIEQLYKEKYGE